ncbi:MAG: hypothetical protein U9R25_12260 [Chloroflexota bacterium]|nr:hypothetical protein [Chloroflexota bacterium]
MKSRNVLILVLVVAMMLVAAVPAFAGDCQGGSQGGDSAPMDVVEFAGDGGGVIVPMQDCVDTQCG